MHGESSWPPFHFELWPSWEHKRCCATSFSLLILHFLRLDRGKVLEQIPVAYGQRHHPWMSLQLQSPTGALEVLLACSSVPRWCSEGVLALPSTNRTPPKSWTDWGLNWEPSASQLSLLQTELPPLHLSFSFISLRHYCLQNTTTLVSKRTGSPFNMACSACSRWAMW